MTLMLDLFFILSFLELVFISRLLWPIRRPVAAGLAISLALVSGGIVGIRPSLATGLVAILSLYRVVNLLRVVKDRSEAHHLLAAVRRTTLSLVVLQLIVLLALAIADATRPLADVWWAVLSLGQLAAASVLYGSTRRQLRTTLPPAVSEHFSDSQLPSLSVCIPARNETIELEACLRSLIASDYPKLEIIVLDDCSQGRQTSDIIRGFAHDGVRFIKGDDTPDSWLAKNWAYEQLFAATSGKLVLFCGVDVRFAPTALRSLVTTQLAKEKRMVSVIPRNALPKAGADQVSLLIQPARYAWELAPPRRLFNRPPVLSSCWVAERTLIERNGAFAAVKGSISPEAYFARKAILKDGYSFIQSTSELDVSSAKTRPEQWATAVRTRYPQLRRRPELVFAVSLIELSLIVAPPIMTVVGLLQGLWLQAFCAGLATTLVAATYARIIELTYRQSMLQGSLLAPLAALLDVYIRHESLWRYEFGEIIWKGRNVCMPIMRVIPRFPSLEDNSGQHHRHHKHHTR